jgi:hypothetical protein
VNKTDLLSWLKEENRQWEAFLDQIGPERMKQPGVAADWSIKDIIAHLAGWNRWLVDRFQAAQHGEAEPAPPWPPNLESEDEINSWIYETNRKRSLDEVMDESRRVMGELFAAIESLPEQVRIEHVEPQFNLVWVGEERFLPGEFFDHFHDDHEADIRAWLQVGAQDD